MTCLECSRDIQAYPCPCGYQPKGPTGLNWVMQECSRSGCTTAIRVLAGQQRHQPVCKWCEAIDAHGDPFAVYDDKLKAKKPMHQPRVPDDVMAMLSTMGKEMAR